MYRLVYEKRVLKDLDKIPDRDVERIVCIFKELLTDPFPVGSKKLSGRQGLYRVKQGDYRIVYTVDHREKIVKIVFVKHRKEAYRNL